MDPQGYFLGAYGIDFRTYAIHVRVACGPPQHDGMQVMGVHGAHPCLPSPRNANLERAHTAGTDYFLWPSSVKEFP